MRCTGTRDCICDDCVEYEQLDWLDEIEDMES